MKIKEDIRFRVSPDVEEYLFMIKSKSVFEFRGRHEVLDADGAVIGLLEKDFGKSLLRSHWHVRDATGTEVLEAHESSWIVALLRRFADLGPDYLSLLTWLPFNFTLRRGGEEVGTYKRVLGKFRDRYLLEVEPAAAADHRRCRVHRSAKLCTPPCRTQGRPFPIAAPAERERVFTISDDEHTPHRMYLRSARSDPPRGRMWRRLRTEARGRRGRRRRAIGRPEQLRR